MSAVTPHSRFQKKPTETIVLKSEILKKLSGFVQQKWKQSLKLRSTVYYSGSSIGCQVVRFAGIIISTKFIESDNLGVYAVFLMIIGLSSLTSNFGLTNGLIARQGISKKFAEFEFTTRLLLGCISFIILGGLYIAFPIFDTREAWLFPAAVLVMFCQLYSNTGLVMAQKKFRFKMLAFIEVLSTLTWVSTLSIFLFFDASLHALIVSLSLEWLVRFTLIFGLEGRKYCRFRINRPLWNYFRPFGVYGAPHICCTSLNQHTDIFLLGFMSTPQEIGVYERLQQFLRIPISVSVNLIDKVALMSFSETQSDLQQLKKNIFQFGVGVLTASFIAVTGLTLLFPFLIKPLIGVSWFEDLWQLWLVAVVFAFFRPLNWMMGLVFQGLGKIEVMFRGSLIHLSCKILLAPVLVYYHGLEGLIIAISIALIFHILYQLFFLIQIVKSR